MSYCYGFIVIYFSEYYAYAALSVKVLIYQSYRLLDVDNDVGEKNK